MRKSSGRIVVVDFGLGAFVEGDIISRITRTGEAAATGLYTAPELVSDPKLLDPKTDIFSLGAVWYELLTGCPPGGAFIETSLDNLHDLRENEKSLLLRCL